MKPIGVFYATREGHTHKIAERVAEDLRKRGFEAEVRDLRGEAAIDLKNFSSAILAASVHIGRHEPEMLEFVKQHRTELEAMPSAFLSVTLSEAGAERANATPEEHARFVADVQGMLDRFFKDTGWHPQRVKLVAGALLYTQYNFLIRFVMRRIARKAGAATDASRDYEYTDWVALDHFVEELVEELPPPNAPALPPRPRTR
jgi:menaquinone-dependent protoporphyrinogen oxidase